MVASDFTLIMKVNGYCQPTFFKISLVLCSAEETSFLAHILCTFFYNEIFILVFISIFITELIYLKLAADSFHIPSLGVIIKMALEHFIVSVT